jgi:hypothetical protein
VSSSESSEAAPADVPRWRRRHRRFPLTPPVPLTIHGSTRPAAPARLVDISRFGSAILAEELLGDPGAVLVLDFEDEATTERASLPCEVRWVLAEQGALPGRWLHGTQFAAMDELARRLVDHLIDVASGTSSRP